MRGDEDLVRRRRFRRGAFRATAMGSKGDGVGEPADDGARGDDGVRSGRRRGAQGGRREGPALRGGMTVTWRRRWGEGIGGLPRSRSGKGEREEWERMGATWGWGLGFQGDKVEWEGPAGPVGWSGGPSACWAEAKMGGGSFPLFFC